jgi:hypothetical protein
MAPHKLHVCSWCTIQPAPYALGPGVPGALCHRPPSSHHWLRTASPFAGSHSVAKAAATAAAKATREGRSRAQQVFPQHQASHQVCTRSGSRGANGAQVFSVASCCVAASRAAASWHAGGNRLGTWGCAGAGGCGCGGRCAWCSGASPLPALLLMPPPTQ